MKIMKKSDFMYLVSVVLQAAILLHFNLSLLSVKYWVCMSVVLIAFFAGYKASKEE